MPNDNIERAVKRGTGEVEGAVYEEMWYEGYGPGGVALYVQILTDNRNRAASDVRSTFTRYNSNLGEPGSVGYLFSQKGLILASGSEEEVMLAALEAGAEDVLDNDDGTFEVVTAPLTWVRCGTPDAAGVAIESPRSPNDPRIGCLWGRVTPSGCSGLIDALDDLDDVQAVFSNYDIDDDVMEKVLSEA
jgi:YebC/PmpR family DNA-binding regulatory protein